MGKPDHAFRTPTHTVYGTGTAGVYRAEPGGTRLHLSLERQDVPPALLQGAGGAFMERAVAAWVIARGGDTLRLNGAERPVSPHDLGRPPAGPVRRVVSIAPSNAEIVGALGATERLVGVESSSDFPPAVRELPQLGPDLAVDMDRLAALAPDLVLASLTVPGMERNIAALERLGLPYLVLAPRGLDDIRADVRRVATALGYAEAAERVVADMDRRLARLRAESAGQPPLPVFLQWWPQPMFSPGRACWSNELIALAGGRNAFADLPGQSGEVTAEQVRAADPAVIFLSWCGVPFDKLKPERIMRRPELAPVRAVRTGHVVPVDEDLLGRPGPRVVEGVEQMAAVIRRARNGGAKPPASPAGAQ